MTRFTFLHAADLHLGSPLTGLSMKDDSVARRFAAASREAFSDLITQALAEQVAFVLVAGDIYDGDWKDTAIGLFFNREVSRLARAGIPLFLIKGNHDAESEITKAVTLPPGVIEFGTRRATTERLEALKVAIHGRSFPERVASENYALTYPPPVPGWFNIGMLHTSLEGNAAHAVYAPCSITDLVNSGYDYWALGHIHEQAVLRRDPWIVYSGNLQGRSVRECGPKGAMLVEVVDGRVSEVRPLIVDKARWLHVSVPVHDAPDEAALLAILREALQAPLSETRGRMTALRITLTGESALHGRLKARRTTLSDEVQAYANHIHDDAWLEALKIATSEPRAIPVDAADLGGLDPAALLADLEQDADMRAKAAEIIALVRGKLPRDTGGDGLDDLDALLADARVLATARTLGGTA